MEAVATKSFIQRAIAFALLPFKSPVPQSAPRINADVSQRTGYGYSTFLYSHSYDGEKDFGAMGPPKSYLPNYQVLRIRSWQAMMDSELAQAIIKRFATWVVGEGLKLQSEPKEKVLKAFGIGIDMNAFTENVEAFYSLYAESREADHARMQSKNEIAETTFINAIVGGDVLVVLRYERDTPTIQLIDGAHVRTPWGSTETYPTPLDNGNRIENGIELSPSNEHIAYWVRKPGINVDYERIEARGKRTGLIMAFLVYGNKYRLDNHRGIPLIAVVLETLKKLERYSSAVLGSAEERAKIAYVIEHGLGSDGENPLAQQAATLFGLNDPSMVKVPLDDLANALADKIAATTGKQTFNLPIASTMKALEGTPESQFKEFYKMHIDIMCSCVGIPPNVAMMLYDASYSSSRAAIQDWSHNLKVMRKKFANQFERPVYSFWFHMFAFKNLIQAPGFIEAWVKKTWLIVEAYLTARFIGANVPHIDPKKEVEAVRLMLGLTGTALPLITLEQATEMLGGGGSVENMMQFARELQNSKDLKIEVPTPQIPAKPGKDPKKKAKKGKE